MSTDILPSHAEGSAADEPSAPRSPIRLVIYGVVVVLVLALLGGVAFAVRSLSGGGSQPEDALPGGALAFAKVDLDPPAGQKINAVRFLRKFPTLREHIGLDADLRKSLFEELSQSAGWQDLDFDKDVDPWLGQRVGVAGYAPPKGQVGSDEAFNTPPVVVALQITDADKARKGLDKLVAATPDAPKPGIVVQDDYALIAEDQATVDKAARDAGTSVLGADGDFSSDLAALGDGVASAWLDTDAVVEALGRLGGGMFGVGAPAAVGGFNGRSAFVLRFDGANALEVHGTSSGGRPLGDPKKALTGFGDLPEGSVVAFGLAGGDKLVPDLFAEVRRMFEEMKKTDPEVDFDAMVADAERELGIELPEDLAVLVGSNLVGALDTESETAFDIGAKVTTDGPRALEVLDRLAAAAEANGEEFPVFSNGTDDGVIVGSSKEQVGRLAAGGSLGDDDVVAGALPDLDDATFALWVDIRALGTQFSEGGGVDENLAPVQGLGITAKMSGNGEADFRLRLVVR